MAATVERRRLSVPVLAVVVGVALLAAACSTSAGQNSPKRSGSATSTSSASNRTAPTRNGPAPTNPVSPPSTGVYLGAFANPKGANGKANGGMGTYNQLLTLEGQIHRKLALDLHYTGWATPLGSDSVKADVTSGRIPVISWECGDTDQRVASGADDKLLVQQAHSIAAVKGPVMIRWFWEMEFTGSNGGNEGSLHAKCLGTQGAAGFRAAWRHIVDVFRANGATNVSWVFCPGQEAYAPDAASRGHAASSYYPGNRYVDWIAEDGYSRSTFTPFTTIVASMVKEYGSTGKPMIVCETGAEAADQVRFFQSIEAAVKIYPQIKGIIYFDSHGPKGQYYLTPQGMAAFSQMAALPYFSAMPSTKSKYPSTPPDVG